MTTVADGLYQFGGMPVGAASPPLFGKQSKTFFVDPVNGADGNPGTSPELAFATLYRAHYMMTAGQNDVCYLIGNGGTTGTARLSTAVAVSAQGPTESPATTGTLTWSKNACHLIGVTAPGSVNARARIAPPTGTYTSATFGSGNMVVVSAQGCYFANLSVNHAFSTGGVTDIAWTDSGGRNVYNNVAFLGAQSAAAAAAVGSMSLLITGSTGENAFYNCTIGCDTSTARTGGFAEMNIAAGSPRNRFVKCVIQTQAGSTTEAFWMTIGASGIDRYVLFDDCIFVNMRIGTGAPFSLMAVGLSLNAAPGGTVLLKDCMATGATKYTTTGVAMSNNAAGAAGGGLAVAIT